MLAASPEVEAGYGGAGTIEIGGTFGLANTDEDYDDAPGSTTTSVDVVPAVNLFLADGFALVGELEYRHAEAKGEGSSFTATADVLGFGAGAAYYLPVGPVRIGPSVTLHFIQANLDIEGDFLGVPISLESTTTGPGARVGVAMKAPVGGGGVVTAGMSYTFRDLENEVTGFGKEKGTQTSIGATFGFGVYF